MNSTHGTCFSFHSAMAARSATNSRQKVRNYESDKDHSDNEYRRDSKKEASSNDVSVDVNTER